MQVFSRSHFQVTKPSPGSASKLCFKTPYRQNIMEKKSRLGLRFPTHLATVSGTRSACQKDDEEIGAHRSCAAAARPDSMPLPGTECLAHIQ